MKAVVFDMDGILFNTEWLCMTTWTQVAEKKGIKNMKEVFFQCVGRSSADTKMIFEENYGEAFSYEAFRNEAQVLYDEYIETNGVPLKEGVYEILAFLKEKGLKIGLASSTRYERVIEKLKAAEIYDYFSVVIGGDMVEHSKPDPDIYLKACKALEVDPKEAVAIEDSYNGIRSAEGAGLRTVMVPDLLPKTEEMEGLSYCICDSLLDLIKRGDIWQH